MSHDLQNPYASPTTTESFAQNSSLGIPAANVKQIEAVIKDARQFWLAIILSFFCSFIGFMLIGPWYVFRLVMWNRLSVKFPVLMSSNPHPGSLQQRFQSSRWKLITGLVVGFLMFILMSMATLILFVTPM